MWGGEGKVWCGARYRFVGVDQVQVLLLFMMTLMVLLVMLLWVSQIQRHADRLAHMVANTCAIAQNDTQDVVSQAAGFCNIY